MFSLWSTAIVSVSHHTTWTMGHASTPLMRFRRTFLVMVSCPLSRWERVRVRGFCPRATGPLTPRPLPLGEGARGASWSCPQRWLDDALGACPVYDRQIIAVMRYQNLLVQPERIKADHIVNPKVVIRIMALDIVVPAVVDLLPGHREQRRVLFHDLFGMADERLALGIVEFTIDLTHELLERGIVPLGIILGAFGPVPGMKIVRWVDQGRHDG